ncbi:MAG: winged helix-turn-helix domain-containing protein [Candidatus Thermoplasmatota archaeon]|nr:winged helix-turn-helix domain-containing protein [Candidatus Thermoplasmatota archaeon]
MVLPFEGVFGNNCELRVIEFLLPLKGMEFNITELAEEACVSRPTATRVVKKFVEHGVMKVSRTQGGSRFYEVNSESPFVKLFEDLNNMVIEQMLDEETLYQIHESMRAVSPIKSPMERKPEIEPEITVYKVETFRWLTPKEEERTPYSPERGPIIFDGGRINGAG